MGAPKIPDKTELERWMRNGRPYPEILAEYETRGIHVTSQALSVFRNRRNIAPVKTWNKDLLPWTVKAEHRGSWAAKMLRAEGKVRRGEPLPAGRIKRDLELWKKRMEPGGEFEGMVVHYDPELPEGFVYVPRREGVDTDLIREPDVIELG